MREDSSYFRINRWKIMMLLELVHLLAMSEYLISPFIALETV